MSLSASRWRARVLADIQAGEVEAEHLDLADHVAQIAVGGERAAVGAQRRLDGAQLGEQLVRRGIGAVAAGAGGAHPLAHEA